MYLNSTFPYPTLGETKDVHRAVKLGEEKGVPCISVVNVVGSLIARATGLGVYLNAGREHAVASTKGTSHNTYKRNTYT